MAGGQQGEVQLLRLLQHGAELDGPVAHHAGVGGTPRLVLSHKGIHDLLGEGLPQVQGVVGDAQLGGHPPGVRQVLQGVAGPLPPGGQVLRPEQGQGEAGGGISLLLKQPGGSGAVHSAAHGHGDGVVQESASFSGRAGHD